MDLIKDTWWNNPVASCESIRWPAEAAPAESPNMVTLMVFIVLWPIWNIYEYRVAQASLYILTPGVLMVMITLTLWDRRQSRKYSFEPIPAQPPCPEETEDK